MTQFLHTLATLFLLCAVIGLVLNPSTPRNESLFTIAQVRAKDASQSVSLRLEALQVLRAYGMAEPYLCPVDVTESMLKLARESKVPEVRVVIYSQLNGLKYPILKAPLMKSLQEDMSYEVRVEAAKALSSFTSDSKVKQALLQAKKNDTSEEVRNQAEASLNSEKEG